MGGSDDGNAHTCIDKSSTNFEVGFLPLYGEPDGQFLQQDLRFLAHRRPSVETTERGRSVDMARGMSRGISSSSRVRGLPTLCAGLWTGLT